MENLVPPHQQEVFNLPPEPGIVCVIKTGKISKQVPMDDVMGDVLLRNLTSAQDMGHNTLGLDSGKERRGPGAVDQAHSNEKQMGIVTGTNERAKPGAQIIKRIDSPVFRQAKICQIHPVTRSPQKRVCFKTLSVFKADLPTPYTPNLGLMARDRVEVLNRQGAARD